MTHDIVGPEMTATEVEARQEEWRRRVLASWDVLVMPPVVETMLDALYRRFPPPYFWLGAEAEAPVRRRR
jgi:hypothetical protein